MAGTHVATVPRGDDDRPKRPGAGKHAAPKPTGRHTATEPPPLVPLDELYDPINPANTGPLNTVSRRNRILGAATVATTGALMIITGSVAATMANSRQEHVAGPERASGLGGTPPVIGADAFARLNEPKVKVETKPAPPPPPPSVEAPPPPPVAVAPPPPPLAPPRVQAPPPPPARPAPAPAPPPPPAPPVTGKAAGIIAAARAQLGRTQDCTMLVTNALAAVGIRHHGWPISYMVLGPVVGPGNAIPGDLLYYDAHPGMPAHIAVYAGNGMAIHGGFNGNQTVEFSATVGYPTRYAPTAYIRVA